jgi:ketosteroid isomerase-like protein
VAGRGRVAGAGLARPAWPADALIDIPIGLGRELIIEKSEELRGLLSSLIETFGTSGMGSAFADAIAAEPGVLMVGTDPAEWWDDPEVLLRVVQVQSKDLQGAATTVRHSVRGGTGLQVDFRGPGN